MSYPPHYIYNSVTFLHSNLSIATITLNGLYCTTALLLWLLMQEMTFFITHSSRCCCGTTFHITLAHYYFPTFFMCTSQNSTNTRNLALFRFSLQTFIPPVLFFHKYQCIFAAIITSNTYLGQVHYNKKYQNSILQVHYENRFTKLV